LQQGDKDQTLPFPRFALIGHTTFRRFNLS
jgi:hypothetical protein